MREQRQQEDEGNTHAARPRKRARRDASNTGSSDSEDGSADEGSDDNVCAAEHNLLLLQSTFDLCAATKGKSTSGCARGSGPCARGVGNDTEWG
jgi:hypothetical protein